MALLTASEAARLANVHINTLRTWIKDGDLAAVKSPGGHWRISREALAAALQQGPVFDENKRLKAALAQLLEAADRFAEYQHQNWSDLQDRSEYDQFTAAVEAGRREMGGE